MVDRLKEILQKILEWWNRFTSKQKTIIISAAAVVVFTVAIIIIVFTRPEYETLITCESSAKAAEVVNILESAGITYRASDDGLVIEVEKSQQSKAIWAMGSEGFVADPLTMDSFMDYGMSITASDREKQYLEWLEKKLEATFLQIRAVKSVDVRLNQGPQNGTLIAQETDGSAYIQLTLDDSVGFSPASAEGMAKAVAAYLHNDDTSNIVIMDQNGKLWYGGDEEYSSTEIATSLQDLQNQAEAMLNSQVRRVFYGTGQFYMVTVAARLDLDYSEYEKKIIEYYGPDGQTDGMKASESTFESSGTNNGVGGVPGTTSNDDDNNGTGYLYSNNYNTGEYESSERNTQYQNNEMTEYQKTIAGSINYANSSVAITMISYRTYNEDTVRRQGLLDGGMSWEDFKAANSADVMLEVPDAYYALAASATGISQDRIAIIAYESPIFNDAEGFPVSGTDILSIVMIVLILGLLAFVVLRSMRSKKGEEEEKEEEELSVEGMLQSTPEEMLPDIDVETKTETRLMIEKFVDENPEAAALLLRNWLNEDWA